MLAVVVRVEAGEVWIGVERRRLVVLEVHLRDPGGDHGGIRAVGRKGTFPLLADGVDVKLELTVVEGKLGHGVELLGGDADIVAPQ